MILLQEIATKRDKKNSRMTNRLLSFGIKKATADSQSSLRKERDSNPWTPKGGQRFSRPPRSTTPASFRFSA